MNEPLALETSDLVHRYGDRLALDRLSVAIPHGGVHAVVGRNGAGKSTLFRILLGFEAPTSGTARLLGVDSTRLSPAARGRIGYVPESPALPEWLTVAELAALQREGAAAWSDATFRTVATLFELSPSRRAGDLSRGERAGLALALAMAPSPDLLLLDEPTAGLDVVASRAFLESLLFAGERAPGTVVVASHRPDEVERIADRILVLDRGALLAEGSPAELQARVTAWTIAGGPPADVLRVLPGCLDARAIDDSLELLVLDADAAFEGRLVAHGARHVAALPIGFDRALDALLRSRPTPVESRRDR